MTSHSHPCSSTSTPASTPTPAPTPTPTPTLHQMDGLATSQVLTAEEEHVMMRKFDIARHRWVGAVVGLAVSMPLAAMPDIFGEKLVVGRKSRAGTDEDVAETVRAIRERMLLETPAKRHSSVLKCVRLVKQRTYDSEHITALEREVERVWKAEAEAMPEADSEAMTLMQWKRDEMAKSAASYRVLLSTILECNLKLVAKMASAFQRRKDSDSMQDFYQAGCMGLLIAIDRFDYRRKLKLSTYAVHWIRQAMQRRTIDYSQPTRKPSYRQDADRRIRRELQHLDGEDWQHACQSERLDEAARRAGLLKEPHCQTGGTGAGAGARGRTGRGHYVDAMSRVSAEMSEGYITRWWQEVGAADDRHMVMGGENVVVRGGVSLENIELRSAECMPREFCEPDTQADVADSHLLSERVEDVLSTLTSREQNVIRWRYGLNMEGAEEGPKPGHTYTLSQVGEALGLTRERVRQVQSQALAKLQDPGRASHLKGFI